jgi:hypothetical protein
MVVLYMLLKVKNQVCIAVQSQRIGDFNIPPDNGNWSTVQYPQRVESGRSCLGSSDF